ncbi:Protein kinase subdomain-containing protein [Trichophyton interdigitale]|uniref:Protein kinase subdomain-containing protein n=1 Tax=Trichophyton interdigitale TaxID=101480 RepID=A0A9P4YMS4_9EURO|nr:Protein kinase subdomain-containing protein [Trichophyton interdigitale]KAF3900518.1 Protein kinase subdomain-containing protein [Trichophyton interdigitale]KAG8211370.1 Protein kinase subdomain-containing protein [Trichophyton interdigitale]
MATALAQNPGSSSIFREAVNSGNEGKEKPRLQVYEDLETGRGSLSLSSAAKMKPRKYDIETLLSIGKNMGKTDCPKRLNLGSFYGSGRKSLGSGSYVLREKSVNHTRTSTDMSVDSDASYHTTQSSHFQYPSRQPKNAPEGNIAQTNEGFARFLKEHASPKHHRVTAGGRIVPMTLRASPTPEFKPAVKGVEPASNQNLSQNPRASHSPMSGNGDESKEDTGTMRRHRTRTMADNTDRPEQGRRRDSAMSQASKGNTTKTTPRYQTPVINAPVTSNPTTPGQIGGINFMPNLVNMGMDGISMPQGQTDQSGFPFPSLQTYYSPAGISQGVPDQTHGAAQAQFMGPTCNIIPYPTPPGLGMINLAQMYPLPGAFSPFTGHMAPGLNAAQTVSQPNDSRGLSNMLDNAIQEFETISAQLSNLDRYMAVHTWDIDPSSKKILVIQRMELVTKLDTARVLKENIEAMLRSSGSNDSAMAAKAQQKCPNAGSHDFITVPPCTPVMTPQGGYYHPGLTNTGGSSFSMSDVHGFMSPVQATESPYMSPESYCDNGFLANMPASSATSNNWTALGVNNMGILERLADDDDEDDMRIITSATGQKIGEPTRNACTPPELSVIYQKIEQAAKRNEPLGPLFQELAKVTAHITRLGTNRGRNPDISGSGRIEVPRGRPSARLEIVDPKARQTAAPQTPKPTQTPAATTGSSKEPAQFKKLSKLQQSPLSFSPCKQHCRKHDSKKVETLTMEQKVNAHGYLPPFDGGGDAPGRASQTEPSKIEAAKPAAPSTENTWMDLLRTRPNANPMDVRRFFKLLRDEDSVALDKYRREGDRRAFG